MARMPQDKPRIVFSSDAGRVDPDQDATEGDAAPFGDGVARVRPEKKGRGGKIVTTVADLPLDRSALAKLAKDLKRVLGTGGSAKDGVVEIQGDHVDRVLAELERRGFAAKRSGG